MSNPRSKRNVSSARRKQWEGGTWEVSEWDALFRLFPSSFTAQLQKWEREDELERQETFGNSVRRRNWLELSDGVGEVACKG
jgi:hypothetical protein